MTPEIGSVWRHRDGGLYVIVNNTGQVRVGRSKWYPAIKFDHSDGCISMGPYTTDLKYFLDRFTRHEAS